MSDTIYVCLCVRVCRIFSKKYVKTFVNTIQFHMYDIILHENEPSRIIIYVLCCVAIDERQVEDDLLTFFLLLIPSLV